MEVTQMKKILSLMIYYCESPLSIIFISLKKEGSEINEKATR